MSVMVKYLIKHQVVTLWVWYRSGHLHKMQVRKGSFKAKGGAPFHTLSQWVPLLEEEIPALNEKYKAIEYAKVEKDTEQSKSLYGQFVSDWWLFYERLNGVEPHYQGKDGQAIKKIIDYLTHISKDDVEARGTWAMILGSWNSLPEFYRNKPDLTFINSKINEIITHLKNDQSNQTKANRDANDLRSEI